MFGNIFSFVVLVKYEVVYDIGMYCCIDWFVLVLKIWLIILKEIFVVVVKFVSFIRVRFLNYYFLKKFG